MIRAHAGEPSFVFKWLQISVYELRTDGELTSSFDLLAFHAAWIPSEREHGVMDSDRCNGGDWIKTSDIVYTIRSFYPCRRLMQDWKSTPRCRRNQIVRSACAFSGSGREPVRSSLETGRILAMRVDFAQSSYALDSCTLNR